MTFKVLYIFCVLVKDPIAEAKTFVMESKRSVLRILLRSTMSLKYV